MNKFFKWGAVTAGVLGMMGIVLALIFAAVGGRTVINSYDFLNVLVRSGIIKGDIEAVGDKLEQLDILDNDIVIIRGDGPTELYVNGAVVESNIGSKWQVSADNLTGLHMEVGAGQFYIKEKETDDQTIDITISGLGKSSYYVKNGTLYIEGFLKTYGKTGWADDNEITVELPRGMELDQAEIEIGAGTLKIDDLLARSADIEIGAGEVVIEKADIRDYFTVEIGAGRLETRNMKAENVELSLNLGECLYQGEVGNNLDAQCNMGSMELLIEGEEEDYNYEIECAAGTIDMNGYSFDAVAAERNIDNGASGTFDISCNMGEIRIAFTDK